ncbi:MAG TPA: amino acid adenylation domain-containing protein [Puia sp.]|nr:amino acid adenylation domain-containing protein [Puia sp.]
MEALNNCVDRLSMEKNLALMDLFYEQVARIPEKKAVIFQDREITYIELYRRAGVLAHHLTRVAETGEGVIIGVLLEPSIEMVVAILAILKTRSAYLPIDTGAPAERLLYMLREAGVSTLITQAQSGIGMAVNACKVIDMGRFDFLENETTEWNSRPEGPVGDLACVLFTSGSTGRPKGVMISHKGIIRLATDNNFFNVLEDDRVLNVLNYAFDGTLFNFFSTLLNGATLHLVTKDLMMDLKKLSSYIRKQKISVVNLTTAFFNLVVEREPSCFNGLRKVLFGGERVSLSPVRRFFDSYGAGRLIHVYGPTENTTFSSFYEVNSIPQDARTIPIGKAVSGTTCRVLDESGQVVKEGQQGELFVGGEGLALGYIGNGELWRSKLLPDPHDEGGWLYRTGDIVRSNRDGDLEFICRNDNQVKIRGFRVEPEEVELALMETGVVQDIKVAVLEGKEERTLVAFLIPSPSFGYMEFIALVKNKLPEYMIPGIFYRAKEFPLTENGKVDVRSMVENKDSYLIISPDSYVAGDGNLQNRLLDLWKKILDKDQLGVEDDFFLSGGNSIKAIQLISEIERLMAVGGRLEQLYKYPTVKMFADHLKEKNTKVNIKYCISLNQFEPGNNNFFVVPSSWGEENDMNGIAYNMNGSANFFKLQIQGMFEDKLESSLPRLAEKLVKKIQRIPAGECDFIIGYSWGCFLAFEMVKQLEIKGRNICLFLFDCDPLFQIDRSEIRFDRYDFFTLETILQYLPDIKTQEELDRLKRFWMNNNTIHADYLIKDTIRSDIYAFEALEYNMIKQRADMQLWRSYTAGNFNNFQVPGNHDSIIKENQQFITDTFSRLSNGSTVKKN